MEVKRFFKFFPTPTYLQLPAIGLDISDQSIKFVEIEAGNYPFRIKQFGELPIPVGAVEAGRIKDPNAIAQVLGDAKKQFKFNYAYFSLPEEQTYVVEMKIPAVEPREIKGCLELQLEEHIPVPSTEVVFDYEICHYPQTAEDQYLISVSIVPKKVLDEYTDSLIQAGITPIACEIEVQSLGRSLIASHDQGTYMVADIGKTRAGFSVISHGITVFTTTVVGIGGDDMTKAIEKSQNIEAQAAEELKMKQGMVHSEDNKALFEALIPIVSTFRDEISRYLLFWNNRDRTGKDAIQKLIFCGGQAALPGLLEYISANLGVPVVLGNPWVNFPLAANRAPSINQNDSLRYATVIGLALRGFIKE